MLSQNWLSIAVTEYWLLSFEAMWEPSLVCPARIDGAQVTPRGVVISHGSYVELVRLTGFDVQDQLIRLSESAAGFAPLPRAKVGAAQDLGH